MTQQTRPVRIVGRVAELSDAPDGIDLKSLPGYHAAKAADEHPCFAVLEVGEDGASGGNVLGRGNVTKIWPPERIQELAAALNPAHGMGGAEVYDGHNADNSTRPGIGRVIASYAKRVGDKLKAYVVSYLYPGPARDRVLQRELDTCSIEAECDFDVDPHGSWLVQSIKRATGVVLASSREHRPGFPNATILATVQELEAGGKEPMPEEIKLSDIKAAVTDKGIAPDQIFSKEELLGLPIVKDAVKAEVDEQAAAVTQDLQPKLTAAEQKATTLEQELAPIRQQQQREATNKLIAASPLLADAEKPKVAYLQDRLNLDHDALGKAGDALAKQVLVDTAVKGELDSLTKLGVSFAAQQVDNGATESPAAANPRPAPTDANAEPKAGNMDAGTNPLIP